MRGHGYLRKGYTKGVRHAGRREIVQANLRPFDPTNFAWGKSGG